VEEYGLRPLRYRDQIEVNRIEPGSTSAPRFNIRATEIRNFGGAKERSNTVGR
jgi:hypothetical protein